MHYSAIKIRVASMITLKRLGLATCLVTAVTALATTASFAATFNFTSDDCSNLCGDQGSTVTAVVDPNNSSDLLITVTLGGNLAWNNNGSGAGIDATFAFSLNQSAFPSTNPTGTITISNATTGFNNGTEASGTVKMDGAGTFENFGYFVDCTSCSPNAPLTTQTLKFDVSAAGMTGAQLLAALQPDTTPSGTGTSFFAADVVSCNGTAPPNSGTNCLGNGNGATGVIDATAAPLPTALVLFGSVLFGGLGLSARQKRRSRGPVSVIA